MKLFAVLRRFAPLPILLLATLVGVLAGLAGTGLLIVIDQTTSHAPISPATLAWRFAGLVALVAVTRFSSSIMLARLGARAATILQVQLARRIVAAPLRRLEEVGSPRLMASLVDDVTEVSHTLTVLPNSLINLVVVIGSLCYMGYLSPGMLGGVLGVMALTSTTGPASTWPSCVSSTRCGSRKDGFRPPISPMGNASGWPCSPPTSKSRRSSSSTMGRRPGPGVQGRLLPRAAAGPQGARQDRLRHQPRRSLLRRRRPGRQARIRPACLRRSAAAHRL